MYAAHVLCISVYLHVSIPRIASCIYASVPGFVCMHLCEQLDWLPAFKLLLVNKCQMNIHLNLTTYGVNLFLQ